MPKLSPRAALLCALTCLAAVASAAPAVAAPRITMMKLSVAIHGTHADAWHYADDAFPDPNRTWVQGGGTQSLSFSSAPARYLASAASGRAPGGVRLTPLTLAPLKVVTPMPVTVKRTTSAWQHNDPTVCDREGGCGDADLIVPLHQNPSCPDQRSSTSAQLGVEPVSQGASRYRLAMRFSPIRLDGLWSSCPPDIDGARRSLLMGDPGFVAFGGALKAILHLRRGETATLKGSERDGATNGILLPAGCPELSGAGLQECGTTQVTLTVKRLS